MKTFRSAPQAIQSLMAATGSGSSLAVLMQEATATVKLAGAPGGGRVVHWAYRAAQRLGAAGRRVGQLAVVDRGRAQAR